MNHTFFLPVRHFSWLVKRQFNDEGCPPHVIVFRVNRSAVVLDDAFTDRQTQSGAFSRIFGGKERLKNQVQVFRRNTTTVIGNNQEDRRNSSKKLTDDEQ